MRELTIDEPDMVSGGSIDPEITVLINLGSSLSGFSGGIGASGYEFPSIPGFDFGSSSAVQSNDWDGDGTINEVDEDPLDPFNNTLILLPSDPGTANGRFVREADGTLSISPWYADEIANTRIDWAGVVIDLSRLAFDSVTGGSNTLRGAAAMGLDLGINVADGFHQRNKPSLGENERGR